MVFILVEHIFFLWMQFTGEAKWDLAVSWTFVWLKTVQNYTGLLILGSLVWWVDPSQQLSTHQLLTYSILHGGMAERIGRAIVSKNSWAKMKTVNKWREIIKKMRKKPTYPTTNWCKGITHHLPPADQCPASHWAIATLDQLPSVLLLRMMLCGMEHPFGQWWSAGPAVLPPSLQSCCWECGQHEKQRWPWFCASTAQQLLKHSCINNTALVTNLNLSTIQAAVKKSTSISARTSTPGIKGVRLVLKYINGIEV